VHEVGDDVWAPRGSDAVRQARLLGTDKWGRCLGARWRKLGRVCTGETDRWANSTDWAQLRVFYSFLYYFFLFFLFFSLYSKFKFEFKQCCELVHILNVQIEPSNMEGLISFIFIFFIFV
jgi:hypothetical protein